MLRVVACITQHHNFYLLALAACICVATCAGAAFVIRSLDGLSEGERPRWRFLAGLFIGGGAWSTHFVAMLAYDAGLPMAFDVRQTLLSALVGALLAWAAISLLNKRTGPPFLAGIVLSSAIVGLHYVGMAGIVIAAQKIWKWDLVAASWMFCSIFSVSALYVLRRYLSLVGQAFGAALLVSMVLSLHLTGMAALELVLDPRIDVTRFAIDPGGLAVMVATGTFAVLLAGVALSFSQQRILDNTRALMLHDALTGLPNARRLETSFERLMSSRAQNTRLAVLAIDLDRFSEFNKLYGQSLGDQVLVQIGVALQEMVAGSGFVARTGGDEFVVLYPATGGDDIISRTAALLDRISSPLLLGGATYSITASAGVALAPGDGRELPDVLRLATIALSRAKEDGQGRFAFFSPDLDAQILERVSLENDLRIAIRNDQIDPHFQPLVNLSDGTVVGYEVLARWRHDIRGDVPPAIFIPRAEKMGLIGEMTLALLRKACRYAVTWPQPLTIALNISAGQLRDPFLPQSLLRVATETGLAPSRLKIEVTEDALVQDFELARAILRSIKKLNMLIALDDFGTGYSSLRHLLELPFDTLKIDQSFVRGMSGHAEKQMIVRAIIQMAHSLHLETIAEGIESECAAKDLRDMGCTTGQGYLFGRAQPGEAIALVQDDARPSTIIRRLRTVDLTPANSSVWS